MTRFSSVIATAARLVQKNGQDMTFVRFTNAAPADPTMPWRVDAVTEDTTAFKGVMLDYPPDFVESWSLQRGDKIILIAGADLAVTPTEQDHIRLGDAEYSIEHLKTIAPNGELILHTLQVRKWPRRSS